MISSEVFEKFTVYKETEAHQFCYITIGQASFYEDFASYLLDFEMIKKHATVNLGVGDDLTLDDFNEIYNRLIAFVDFEKIYTTANLDQAIIDTLDAELIKETADLRRDKWGRIGEYIFNAILDTYFNLDCIVRKFALNTSPNMSVYGIDTIHCSLANHTLFFGESKMVGSLTNGVTLITESLKSYEAQIAKEYFTIRNNNFNKNTEFLALFEYSMKRCLNFTSFIKAANITKIGVPVFISHGGDYTPENVFKKLREIPMKQLFDLETQYYLISVPIIDKNKFRDAFVNVIRQKIEECQECIAKLS